MLSQTTAGHGISELSDSSPSPLAIIAARSSAARVPEALSTMRAAGVMPNSRDKTICVCLSLR